jgi:hypothetical protein
MQVFKTNGGSQKQAKQVHSKEDTQRALFGTSTEIHFTLSKRHLSGG